MTELLPPSKFGAEVSWVYTAFISGGTSRSHRITESQYGFGWKGLLNIIWSKPPAMGRDFFH